MAQEECETARAFHEAQSSAMVHYHGMPIEGIVSLLEQIVRKTGIHFRPAETSALEQFRSLGLPDDVVAFYREHEPEECAEIKEVRLWPIADILTENKDYVPGADIYPLGYVVFATTLYGDAFCFDLNARAEHSAPVVLVAHDLDWTDAEMRKDLAILAKMIAPSLDGFLERYAAETLDIQPLYPRLNT